MRSRWSGGSAPRAASLGNTRVHPAYIITRRSVKQLTQSQSEGGLDDLLELGAAAQRRELHGGPGGGGPGPRGGPLGGPGGGLSCLPNMSTCLHIPVNSNSITWL